MLLGKRVKPPKTTRNKNNVTNLNIIYIGTIAGVL